MIFSKKMFQDPQTRQMNEPKMFRKKKKSLSDDIFLHFSSKVQNLTAFSFVYMIRIPFFGPGFDSEWVSARIVNFVVCCVRAGDLTRAGLITYWRHCCPTAQETQSTTRADSGYETCSYCCLELPERWQGSQILGRIGEMALRRIVERRIHQTVQGRLS